MKNLRPLYDPSTEGSPMRVACFMSGSGTNVVKIIEAQKRIKKRRGRAPFEVLFIFSDNKNSECRGKDIAWKFEIPYVCHDIVDFYLGKNCKDKKDLKLRGEFDKWTMKETEKYKIDVVALCGYMSLVTNKIYDNYVTVNVHPADLSIKDPKTGKRKFTGAKAVKKTILAGEKYLRSTTHLATEKADMGPTLMISNSLKVDLPSGVKVKDLEKKENRELLKRIVDKHQDELKRIGDWIIFPLTLQMISEGRFSIDEEGNTYVDGKLVRNGYRLG